MFVPCVRMKSRDETGKGVSSFSASHLGPGATSFLTEGDEVGAAVQPAEATEKDQSGNHHSTSRLERVLLFARIQNTLTGRRLRSSD